MRWPTRRSCRFEQRPESGGTRRAAQPEQQPSWAYYRHSREPSNHIRRLPVTKPRRHEGHEEDNEAGTRNSLSPPREQRPVRRSLEPPCPLCPPSEAFNSASSAVSAL